MGKPKTTPAKNQQSISSFFIPKSSQASQFPSTPLPRDTSTLIEDIYDAENDGEADRPLKPLANGITKRSLAEDGDDEDTAVAERPAKRVRSNVQNETSSFFGGPAPCRQSTAAPKIAPRTECYLYSSSQSDREPEDEAARARKEELHQKFVKKLVHPDAIAQIKRKNFEISEETEALDEDVGEGEVEETPPPPQPKKKGAKTGKLTPMELQILDIKRKHMDTLLIVEVGYKFKFYGEDARIAAKELSIVCIPGKFRFDEHPSEAHWNRFASASIPVHRLPVHAKRLVAAGHKIGIVRQIETAALKKAGDNRNAPFIRKLTNVYTKGTYVDDIEGLGQPTDAGGAPASGYLLCITESKAKGWGTDERVDIGMLAVQPATGDVIYDNFEDGFMRNELETRLHHIAPCELLIVGDLTKATDKLVQHLSGSTNNVFGDRMRVERVGRPKTMAAEAYSHVTQFYADKLKTPNDSAREQSLLDKVLKLEEPVTICLSAMITHLTEYGLEHVFDLTKYFQSFSTRSHMLLNGNTLTSLEIYKNQTDHTEKGSLFWTLDRTQTRFGQRLLRKWVGRPLLDKRRLEERVAAVEELSNDHQTPKVDKLRALLKYIKSDLERSLIRIYYGKCTRPELLAVLQTLQRVANEYATVKSPRDAGFDSNLINEAIASLPVIEENIITFLSKINAEAARIDDKYALFHGLSETDSISDHKLGIAAVEQDLSAHRSVAASLLRKKTPVPYVTVAGIEYLIEVLNTELKQVPASWVKVSGTKKLSRFHTPEVIRMLRERDQHKESLSAACDVAYRSLLSDISAEYALLRDTVSNLSTLDCLLSLARVAQLPGWTKPTFSSDDTSTEIQLTDARHPMIEQLLPSSQTYIPNTISLSNAPSPSHHSSESQAHPQHPSSPHAILLTGPNMGGKSSLIRTIALLTLLAQIGSFIPCTSSRLSLLDGIYTRMGAYDSLFQNQSTFQVELSETAEILRGATRKSLVILDELGRGTSTHDGEAIAGSVLEYLVREVGCLSLFVTHYQSLASVARGFEHGGYGSRGHVIGDQEADGERSSGDDDGENKGKVDGNQRSGALRNMHMKFEAKKVDGGEEEITFLYEVGEGVAHRSYGLNVARLAKVPKSVLDTAALKSHEMEMEVKKKRLVALSKMMVNVFLNGTDQLEQLMVGIEQL